MIDYKNTKATHRNLFGMQISIGFVATRALVITKALVEINA